jgi:Fusaric acid resistance protein-like
VLAASAVTLVAGLAVMFGVHRFVAAYLLNVWFLITLAVAANQNAHITSHTWAQVLAWVGGCVLWIAVTFGGWLIRGRHDQTQPFAEIPGDTSRRKLTPPLIVFALSRAIVIAVTFALAFGLNLNHGYWMPFAAIIAMKSSLDQSTIVAAQRVIGTLIGAVAAALVLLMPASEQGLRLVAIDRGLEVVALVLLMHAVAIRFWNYALYCGAIAAAVLILIDLLHPSNYSDEGYRVLWTLCGVGIGVLAMLLLGLLAKRNAKAPPQPTAQRA